MQCWRVKVCNTKVTQTSKLQDTPKAGNHFLGWVISKPDSFSFAPRQKTQVSCFRGVGLLACKCFYYFDPNKDVHLSLQVSPIKKTSVIQHDYKKCGTQARVFSKTLTLAHGNSKNEIRQRNRRKSLEERSEYGKRYSGHERKMKTRLPRSSG